MASGLLPALAMLGFIVCLIGSLYAAARLLTVMRSPLRTRAYLGGAQASQHAFSRFHARWYLVTLVFLPFDMEMIFMYPWTLVVGRVGVGAVVEMFLFLAVLMTGVVYAWREGAFRWT